MGSPAYSVNDVLPHGPSMILLDEIVDYGETEIVLSLRVREQSRFFVPGAGVPVHIAIEWMAQACGAYAGILARQAGGKPVIGYLLGTRRFVGARPYFAEGETAFVFANRLHLDSEMAVFDCRVEVDKEIRAAAQLAVFQPKDNPAFLAAKAEE